MMLNGRNTVTDLSLTNLKCISWSSSQANGAAKKKKKGRCQRENFLIQLLHFREGQKIVVPVAAELVQQSQSCEVFYGFLVSYSQGNKGERERETESSLANFPSSLSQVGFPHWTWGQARMLSRFWTLWFKVWSVLSDTALWANTMSSYGIQVIHERVSEMSYLFQIPPHTDPLLLFNPPQLHHLPFLCSNSDQSIIFAPIFVFFFNPLWCGLLFFMF